MEEMVSSKES